ncbi:FAD-dependent oxidoreductase [Fangia hongkongensis]|uniref:FAD-dependent oxidoreductase n=1 Tax=Fangia hongkongensis TaxID=270495 RepID=UPI000371BEAC|nr:FAD-dependent oxidoreductase [Fangia hongkongensis]MBK2123740.1 FAD-dependent oxidoreductase [Fangia hongkongensis]
MKEANKVFHWCVIGGGPAGVTALGKLIDQGVEKEDIIWISDHFSLGDLGTKWLEVPANTSVGIFKEYLKGTRYFDYDNLPSSLEIKNAPDQSYCTLGKIAEPLSLITKALRSDVTSIEGVVEKLDEKEGKWQLSYTQLDGIKSSLMADKVILATGSKPVEQRLSNSRISLQDGLSPSKLQNMKLEGKTIGVFGGSHSAILVVMNMLNQGAKVINFYKHPLRYAHMLPQGILFDNTGLKGDVAKWSKENCHGQNQHLERIYYQDERKDAYLDQCDYIVDAIGFKNRNLALNGVLQSHCPHSGMLAYKVFGCGIAYPEEVTGIAGNTENNVGLKKFGVYLNRVLPIWMAV